MAAALVVAAAMVEVLVAAASMAGALAVGASTVEVLVEASMAATRGGFGRGFHGGYGRRFAYGPGLGYGFYPYGYYDDYAYDPYAYYGDGGCYVVQRRVHTKHRLAAAARPGLRLSRALAASNDLSAVVAVGESEACPPRPHRDRSRATVEHGGASAPSPHPDRPITSRR